MSDFFQFLNTSSASIETGVVVGAIGDKKYQVRISGKDFTLNSAMSDSLVVGDRVVINRDQYKRYIVGTTKRAQSDIEPREIVIDG